MDTKLFITVLKDKFNIKFLDIYTDVQFSSSFDNYRLLIRKDILKNYAPLFSSSEKRNIVNLEIRPQVENLFFSISHNKLIGGYVACEQRVGFDLEDTERISLEVINRVCTAAEVAACPEPQLLWSAKESAFKTLKKGTLMSDIEIHSWNKEDEVFYFEATCAKLSKKIKGAVTIDNNIMAACSFLI